MQAQLSEDDHWVFFGQVGLYLLHYVSWSRFGVEMRGIGSGNGSLFIESKSDRAWLLLPFSPPIPALYLTNSNSILLNKT